MNQTATERIVSKAGVCGGKPCIAGTRIRVQDIYIWHELQGQSADEIVSGFPHLKMSDVYHALAYFWDHRDEILRQLEEQTAFVEQFKKLHPSPLMQKLKEQEQSSSILMSTLPLPSQQRCAAVAST
jgi:uncharacterized protein (DUF433 family)